MLGRRLRDCFSRNNGGGGGCGAGKKEGKRKQDYFWEVSEDLKFLQAHCIHRVASSLNIFINSIGAF